MSDHDQEEYDRNSVPSASMCFIVRSPTSKAVLQKAIAVRSNGFDPFWLPEFKKSPGTESWVILKPQNSTLVNPMCVMSSSKRSSSKFNDQMAGSPSSQLLRKKETVLPEARRQWWLSHELPHCWCHGCLYDGVIVVVIVFVVTCCCCNYCVHDHDHDHDDDDDDDDDDDGGGSNAGRQCWWWKYCTTCLLVKRRRGWSLLPWAVWPTCWSGKHERICPWSKENCLCFQ